MSFLLKVYLANLLYTCRGEEIDLEIYEKKNDELSVGYGGRALYRYCRGHAFSSAQA